jgi:hypothetical protein
MHSSPETQSTRNPINQHRPSNLPDEEGAASTAFALPGSQSTAEMHVLMFDSVHNYLTTNKGYTCSTQQPTAPCAAGELSGHDL